MGFNSLETLRLARLGVRCGADFIEWNTGCPNVKNVEGEPDELLSYDLEGMEETLEMLDRELSPELNLSVKLSPIFGRAHRKELVELLARFQIVKAVVTSNTIPDTQSFDDAGVPHITFKDGLAGGAGGQLHYTALGQVQALRALLPPRIRLIGVGGVRNGRNARDFLLAGADVVEIGTGYYVTEDEGVFGNVAAELIDEGLKIGLFDEKEVEALAAQAPQ